MIMHPRYLAHGLVLLGVLTGSLSSCRNPIKKLRGDRAFITYSPPPAGSSPLKVAVKDLIDVKGMVTTAGSEYLYKHGIPAEKDAACLAPLRARHVWIVGKTNLNELALGGSGINNYFGTPKNHLTDESRLMPGGSSSGSAVAVATGKADIAIGTDTAGSIRTPSACCGIFGLKTTKGLISLKGVHPVSAKHLDTVGPMASSVPKLVEGMDLLKPGTAARYEQEVAARPSASGMKVGRLYIPGTEKAVDDAVDRALEKAGFKVVRLNEAFEEAWKTAKSHGNSIAVVEGYEADKEFLDKPGVSSSTKAALLLGDLKHDRKSYTDALAWKTTWQRLLQRKFNQVDFIALPTLKGRPLRIPLIGKSAVFEAFLLEYQNTVPVNYAGNPAVAIPIPLEDKRVPVTSLQLIGPRNSEAKLLNAARIVASKSA
jgi:amidase